MDIQFVVLKTKCVLMMYLYTRDYCAIKVNEQTIYMLQ
jgi:hypothetical protein